MTGENTVLCACSAYVKKYYFNDIFSGLPDKIQRELRILCVLFTEDAGGIITFMFDGQGSLKIETRCDEGDLLYDEISCRLKIEQMRKEKRDLFESLEMYYKYFFLKDAGGLS